MCASLTRGDIIPVAEDDHAFFCHSREGGNRRFTPVNPAHIADSLDCASEDAGRAPRLRGDDLEKEIFEHSEAK